MGIEVEYRDADFNNRKEYLSENDMSGDAKKKQKGFTKAKGAAAADAKKNGVVRGEGEPQRGAGICTKLVFFLLLTTFSVLVTINLVDYKQGQLKEAYLKHIPEEVRVHLDEAGEQAAALSLQAYDHMLLGYDMGMKYAREYTKGVKIGDFDIGELLFPEARENEEEALKKAKENMKKINDAVKKKEREEAERKKTAEEEAKRKAEAEAQKKKAAEAKKKAEEEAKKKAAEEAERKKEAEAKKKAEDEKKRAEAEAKRRAEEAKRKAEEEAKRKAEEAKKKAEDEAKKMAEEE